MSDLLFILVMAPLFILCSATSYYLGYRAGKEDGQRERDRWYRRFQ